MSSDLDKISLRQKQIADQMAALQREAEELAVAKRVITELSAKPEPRGVTLLTIPKLKPRPPNIPTTFEMMEKVLEGAEKAGKDGLTSKELVQAIREKYWPGVVAGQVLPTIYGFLSNNRVHKTAGGKFKRMKR